MNSDWLEVRLGEVFAPANEKLGLHDQEPVILSLSKYEGFVRAEEYFDKRIASAKLDTYKVVPPDGWAYSTIHIDEGSIARNTLGIAGVISPMYTTMRWIGQAHEPAYFELLLTSPALLRRYSDNARGSINRRRSLPFEAFSATTVLVPPLEVQRRIVDVVEIVDTHLASLAREMEALDLLLNALLEEWHAQSAAAAGLPPLGDLAVVRSGPSWAADEESDVPSDGAARVLKITNTKQDGSLDLTGRTYVTGLPARTLLLDDCSLIVIRTNGNRDRIGNVYRPSPEARGCAVSAFQFIVQAADGSTRDRIYWALRAPSAQSAMSEAASGTTGLGNLAAGWLKARPIVELNDRTRLTFEDTDRQLSLLRSEHEGLGVVRTQLLQALLSGEVEIPEAYGRRVDAGVA